MQGMEHTARWALIINSSTLAYLYVGFFAFLVRWWKLGAIK